MEGLVLAKEIFGDVIEDMIEAEVAAVSDEEGGDGTTNRECQYS